MKKLLIILLIVLLYSCNDTDKYYVNIVYVNGDKELIHIESDREPYIDEGCLYAMGYTNALRCGVRSMTYGIIPLDKLNK